MYLISTHIGFIKYLMQTVFNILIKDNWIPNFKRDETGNFLYKFMELQFYASSLAIVTINYCLFGIVSL